MISVQMAGCAPIVRAFEEGHEAAQVWSKARTDVLGLRVPSAVGDFLILRALRESGGTAIAVEESVAFAEVLRLKQMLKLDAAPEDGAAFAALGPLCERGDLSRDERVVVFLTGSARLYRNILARHGVNLSG
jgi:threonine synthase